MADEMPGRPTGSIPGVAYWRKKPVIVSAIQWTGSNLADVLTFTGYAYFGAVPPEDRAGDPDMTAEVYDELHGTWVHVYDGQWIIRGIQGELYPCAADVFAATYEPAGEPLSDAQCDRLRQMADDHGNALIAVRRALWLAEGCTDGNAEIVAAAWEALKVLSGEEEASDG